MESHPNRELISGVAGTTLDEISVLVASVPFHEFREVGVHLTRTAEQSPVDVFMPGSVDLTDCKPDDALNRPKGPPTLAGIFATSVCSGIARATQRGQPANSIGDV